MKRDAIAGVVALGVSIAAALGLLWRDQRSGGSDHRASASAAPSASARPPSVDPRPTGDASSPIPPRFAGELEAELEAEPTSIGASSSVPATEAASSSSPGARSGRPAGVRRPRLESPPPACVRVAWRWPHAPASSGPATLRMLSDGVVVREETTDARELVVVLPAAAFYGREIVGEMVTPTETRRDGVPAVCCVTASGAPPFAAPCEETIR